MKLLPDSLEALLAELSKLPGVGERSALRYALALLRSGQKNIDNLKRSLDSVGEDISNCPKCHFWSQRGNCPLCESPDRNASILCVVRDNPDVLALERFRRHNWNYHILQGLLSPLNGIGPENIQLESLFKRIQSDGVKELILALDATIEGDATALYIRDRLQEAKSEVKISRTALGLPAGSSVEYLDPSTLEQALNHRTDFS